MDVFDVCFFLWHSSVLAVISLSAITFKVYVLIAVCKLRAGACSECREPEVRNSTDLKLASLSAVEGARKCSNSDFSLEPILVLSLN